MSTTEPSVDFNDTFLSFEHLKESFPEHEIKTSEQDKEKLVPPFRSVLIFLGVIFRF